MKLSEAIRKGAKYMTPSAGGAWTDTGYDGCALQAAWLAIGRHDKAYEPTYTIYKHKFNGYVPAYCVKEYFDTNCSLFGAILLGEYFDRHLSFEKAAQRAEKYEHDHNGIIILNIGRVTSDFTVTFIPDKDFRYESIPKCKQSRISVRT